MFTHIPPRGSRTGSRSPGGQREFDPEEVDAVRDVDPAASGATLLSGGVGDGYLVELGSAHERAFDDECDRPGKRQDIVVRAAAAFTTCLSIAGAIDGDDGTIGDFEVLRAVELWRTNAAVPGTCGETINDFEMLELIETWRSDETITAS